MITTQISNIVESEKLNTSNNIISNIIMVGSYMSHFCLI